MVRLGAADNYKIIAWPHNGERRHVMPGSGEEILRGLDPMLCEQVSTQAMLPPNDNRLVPVYAETDEPLVDAGELLSMWELRKWSTNAHDLTRPAAARGRKPKLTVWYVVEDLTLTYRYMPPGDDRLREAPDHRLAVLRLLDSSVHVVALAPIGNATKRTGL